MYSGADLLAEGFPHSDIRGSTIARISPRLFAACHVLHRLLAPRHPPNALISLHNPRHPHAGPRPASDAPAHARTPSASQPVARENGSRKAATNSHTTNQPIRFTCQTAADNASPKAGRHPRSCGTCQGHGNGQRRSTTPSGTRNIWARTHAVSRDGTKPAPTAPPHHPSQNQRPGWRRSDSNRRPPACKAGALPLSYAPSPAESRQTLVGQGGLEPPTPRLSSVCSDQLSYWPTEPPPKAREPRGNPAGRRPKGKPTTQTQTKTAPPRGCGAGADPWAEPRNPARPHAAARAGKRDGQPIAGPGRIGTAPHPIRDEGLCCAGIRQTRDRNPKPSRHP